MTVKREFELSEEDAAFIDAKVAEGVDADKIVRDGIALLQTQDTLIDRWIREEVLPVHERWKAGLEEEYTLEEVSNYLHGLVDGHERSDAAE